MQIYFLNLFKVFVVFREEWFAGKSKKCVDFMETKTITISPMLKSVVSNL